MRRRDTQGRWQLVLLCVALLIVAFLAVWLVPKLQQASWLPGEEVDWQERAQQQVRLLAEAVQRHAPPAWQGTLSDAQLLQLAQFAWPERWSAMVGTDPLQRQRVCDPWGVPLQVVVTGSSVQVMSAGQDRVLQTSDDLVLIYHWQEQNNSTQ